MVRSPNVDGRTVHVTSRGAVWLIAEPFCAWLDRLVIEAREDYDPELHGMEGARVELSPERRVAFRCDISMYSLYQWRKRRLNWIQESVVDRAICNEGSTHLRDVYPALYSEAA